jgi:phage terminase small subunit
VLNEKQEKFAQAYIIHRNATEAAKAAGYSDRSAANQGYRLINNPEIAERIEDLEKELETNIDVVDEIENQYTFAKANGHTNSAIKALELLSRVRGSKGNSEKELDKKELREEIVKFMEIIGKDEVEEIYKKCAFD